MVFWVEGLGLLFFLDFFGVCLSKLPGSTGSAGGGVKSLVRSSTKMYKKLKSKEINESRIH